MPSTTPTIVFLSAEDLDQLRVCIKSRGLQEKLSAMNNPHGATLMTVTLNTTQRLLSMFEGDARKKLQLYLNDPTPSATFTTIQSVPLRRDQRREVHNLIRQLSNSKLDSGLDNQTSRIDVFVRNTISQYHKQENQRPRVPRQQNTQQQRAPTRAFPYHNTNATRNAPRNKLATRGTAPRAAPSVPLTAEQQAKVDVWIETPAQIAAREEAAAEARAKRRNAPPTKFKSVDWVSLVDATFKSTAKETGPELTPEELAQRAERRKKALPPHMRGAAFQAQNDE
ncbi:unnamed protein product [Aureobasidium vineae]|uniref:R3H domain-containing protein n=1 Tax=Aureobasidium vineae TaxID=2773715 RepID=A0A9N8JBQ4_9PEZI|nr:unnamed protein product [Aureobasidium vineae]